MTIDEAQSVLFDLPSFADTGALAYKPGLERMKSLMEAMHRPDRAFPSILIAGTNGKGSTASILASITTAAGKKTGLHTSPHLAFIGERMRINGVPASPEWIARNVERFSRSINDIGASFFEATAALSLLYFAEKNVDLAIVEVGLGGRLDATNILNPMLSVITGIALDHTEILGETLPELATEKAGIVKPDTPFLTGAVQPEVLSVFRKIAANNRSTYHVLKDQTSLVNHEDSSFTLQTPERTYPSLRLDLKGDHQKRNAALAIRAAEICAIHSGAGESSIRDGLGNVVGLSGLRGRLERIHADPLILVDVAHNAEAVEVTLAAARTAFGGVSHVYIGLLKDKDAGEIGRILSDVPVVVSTVRVSSDRGIDPCELASLFRSVGLHVEDENIVVVSAIDRFLKTSRTNEALLVMGSHVVAADALVWSDARTSETRTNLVP